MQTQDNLSRLQAKQVVYSLKKFDFSPKLYLFWNPTGNDIQRTKTVLKIDFTNSDKIFEEEDLIKFCELFSKSNIFENIHFIIQPSLISQSFSASFNRFFYASTFLTCLELDFSTKSKIIPSNDHPIQDIFGGLRFLKSLKILKISFENLEIKDAIIQDLSKEIENLQLHEIYLNFNQSNISPIALLKLSFALSKNQNLSKLTWKLRNNDLKLTKDALVAIFKNLKTLKFLSLIHLDVKQNPILIIDIVYIIRKCLKPTIFPKLQCFYINANYLRPLAFNQGKFIYYLQRKSGKFQRENPHSELKFLTLKIKKNEFQNDSIVLFFSFFIKIKNLLNLTLRLKENKISFKLYLQFPFKLNIESLALDFLQHDKENMQPLSNPKSIKPLEKIKKLDLKLTFSQMNPLEEMLQIFKAFPNLEDLNMVLKCHRSLLSKEKNCIALCKNFPHLKKLKMAIIDEISDLNASGICTFFKGLKGFRLIESLELIVSVRPNLILDEALNVLMDTLTRLKSLTRLSLNFLSISKTPLSKEMRKKYGSCLMKQNSLTYYHSEDQPINRIFIQKYRLVILAWVLKKELRSSFKRMKIIEEIFIMFI